LEVIKFPLLLLFLNLDLLLPQHHQRTETNGLGLKDLLFSIEQSGIVYTRSVHVVRFIAILLLERQFILIKNIITIGFTGI
jgi:hypothetical protein